ncbi:MAG: succinate dehydrogenase, cytochrome b556 subunit [Pseudomonadota bacterium]
MAHSTTKAGARPVSPHIQIYRWPITMATSITHRATGIALYSGTLLLAAWLTAAAIGPGAHGAFQGFLGSPIGVFILFGYSWAIFYHMANGVRHLFWDVGKGFELASANASGVLVFALSFALTGVAWIAGLALGGGQ